MALKAITAQIGLLRSTQDQDFELTMEIQFWLRDFHLIQLQNPHQKPLFRNIVRLLA